MLLLLLLLLLLPPLLLILPLLLPLHPLITCGASLVRLLSLWVTTHVTAKDACRPRQKHFQKVVSAFKATDQATFPPNILNGAKGGGKIGSGFIIHAFSMGGMQRSIWLRHPVPFRGPHSGEGPT